MSNVTSLSNSKADHPAGKKRGPKKGTPNTAARLAAERKREQAEQVAERYRVQEAKRAVRIQVDQKGTLVVNLVIASVALVTSGIISFNGITSIAPLIGLTFGWQAYLLFGFIEALILYFTLNFLVRSSREDDGGFGDFAGLITFSALAVAGNFWHTATFHEWSGTPDMWAGVVLSVTAPVAVIWVAKSSSSTLFAKSIKA